MTIELALALVGAAANVVMAGAALIALTLWRKQVAGASHHELAKKLSGALRQVAIARAATVKDLKWLQDEEKTDVDATVMKVLAQQSLESDAQQLSDAVDDLKALEGQVAVQWGDEMLELVELIRSESSTVAVHALVYLDPERRDTPVAQIVLSSPHAVAPTFTRGAYEKALDLYTRLAQEWLAVHVGRDGAKAIDAKELAARRKRVDDEVARLAEPERAAIAKEAAEREERIAELGGPEALLRLVREQKAAERAESAALEPEPAKTEAASA